MSEKRRRITVKRKQEMVLRLLRGEPLDALSREFDVPAEKREGSCEQHKMERYLFTGWTLKPKR